MGKSSNRGYFLVETDGFHPHVPKSINYVAAAFIWKSARAFPWYLGSVFLVWASILMAVVSEFNRIAVRIPFTYLLHILGILENIRKPICFHNILKSWINQKAYQQSVCPSDNWDVWIRAYRSSCWADLTCQKFPFLSKLYCE